MEATELRRRGPWTAEEDRMLLNYVTEYGTGNWDAMARNLGLRRSGNSCRLRWVNYLSPDVRRGNITDSELLTILKLHFELGNKWSKIAKQLPGRTDNEIKNVWNTRLKREAKEMQCDVGSEEFLQIMTARIQAAAADGLSHDAFIPVPPAVAAAATIVTTAPDHDAYIPVPPAVGGGDGVAIGDSDSDYSGEVWLSEINDSFFGDVWFPEINGLV